MDEPMIKVIITKYALTSGMKQAEAKLCSNSEGRMIATKENGYTVYYHKPHWHTSHEEANAQVRKMIEAKIKSIKKTLAKMEQLRQQYAE